MPDYFAHVVLPDGLTVRPAVECDRVAYAELTLETLGLYARDVFGLSDDAVVAGATAEFAPDNSWVVEDGESPVGMVVVEPRASEVWLDHMVVTRRYQSRGVGSAVVRAVQEWAQSRDLPVTLSVVDGNPAHELYERLGFVVDRVVPPRTLFRWEAGHRGEAPSAV